MYLCALKTIGMTGQKTPTALGTEKIGKLLMQYAIPAIIAMTASSLYNMVDSIFIGHGVGAMAISGLALTFPLMNLAAAFGSLVGVGAATLVSVKLGQKDYDTAQRVLGNVLVLNIIIGLAFTVLTLIFLDPILYFFGGSEATVGYARDYMVVILWGNVITHLYLGLNAVLRSAGHPQKAMYATIATVVINTILDPIFIYGFGWGIQGAAIATITAQVIALLWQFKLFSNKDELLHFHKGIFRLKKKIVFDSLAIGMAPFLMNLAACFIVILINKGLKQHGGDLAILFSLCFRQAATSALASVAVWLFFSVFYTMIVNLVAKALSPSQLASPYQIVSYQKFILGLMRLAPSELFNEATTTLLMPSVRSLGPLTMEQVQGAIPSPLPLGQSLLVVWPQLTGLIAATVICFALSYVIFMRREVRSR